MQQRVITVVLLIGLCFGLITLGSGMSAWRLPDNERGYSPKQPIDYSHRLHAGELQINCKFCHTAADKSRHAGIPSSDVCMKCHKVVTSSFDVMQEELRIADEKKKLLEESTKLLNEKKDLLAKVEGKPEAEIHNDTKQALKEITKALKETPQALDDLQARADALEIPSKRLKRLYNSLALDENLNPKTDAESPSIPWKRVHNLPDYVYFDHRAHVAAGVTCQTCHGPVESMERVRQFESLSMGWCVNCHREATENGIDGRPVQAATNCAVCHY